MEKGPSIRVLERAFDIIETCATSDADLTLVEISDRTGLALATVHRSIQTMMGRGYIEQDRKTGKYRLGKQFIRIGGLAAARMDIIRIATPYLQELSKKTAQNVNLSIYDKGRALCLINIESFQSSMVAIKVGLRLPIYAGALSKVILAHLPVNEIPNLLTDNLPSFTPQTIAQRETLLAELETIRKQGYSESNGELAIGVTALAAPIFGYNNQMIAGISLSGPDYTYSQEDRERYLQELLSTAKEISKQMGYSQK